MRQGTGSGETERANEDGGLAERRSVTGRAAQARSTASIERNILAISNSNFYDYTIVLSGRAGTPRPRGSRRRGSGHVAVGRTMASLERRTSAADGLTPHMA